MPKRIGHFIDTVDLGGAEAVIKELCHRCSQDDWETVVFHFKHRDLESELRKLHIHTVTIPSYRSYKSVFMMPHFVYSFSRLLREHQIDILHSHLFGPVTAGALACAVAKIPNVGTLHDTYVVEEKPARKYLLWLAARLGTKLVAVSKSMRDYFVRIGAVSEEKIVTIYNGVDIRRFRPDLVPEMRKRLGLSPADFACVSVGRLVSIKQHELLLRAFANLSSDVRARLFLIGEGPRERDLRSMTSLMGLGGKVKFLGFRSDVADILQACDCFLLSSASEGLSCSILEAMSSGLPIIAANVGGNSELVINGENGYLISSKDPLEYASRLEEIVSDAKRRQQMGQASRQRVEELFCVERMIERYEALYREFAV